MELVFHPGCSHLYFLYLGADAGGLWIQCHPVLQGEILFHSTPFHPYGKPYYVSGYTLLWSLEKTHCWSLQYAKAVEIIA